MDVEHPLQTIRQASGVDRMDFAKSIQRTSDYIYQIEQGYERLGPKTALLVVDKYRILMNQLGITVEDLLRGYRGAPRRRSSN